MTTGYNLASGMKSMFLLVTILAPIAVSASHAATSTAGEREPSTFVHSGAANKELDTSLPHHESFTVSHVHETAGNNIGASGEDGDGRDIPDGPDGNGETDTPSSGNGTDNPSGQDHEFIDNCHDEYDGTTICEQVAPYDEHADGNGNQQDQNRGGEQHGQKNPFPDMTIPSGSPDDD